MNYAGDIVKKIRLLGFRKIFICLIKSLYYRLLGLFFKFDSWHARTPYECRTYKKIVVDLVNGLSKKSVVEIGCGLGEIISRIQAEKKYAYDKDQFVINAASFLHPYGTVFRTGSFHNLDSEESCIDVIIAVNVLCNMAPEQAKECLMALLSRIRPTYLVLDSVECDYGLCHDYVRLLPSELEECLKVYDNEARWIFVYKVS